MAIATSVRDGNFYSNIRTNLRTYRNGDNSDISVDYGIEGTQTFDSIEDAMLFCRKLQLVKLTKENVLGAGNDKEA